LPSSKLQFEIYVFGSDQTTGCPRNHMKTFSNIDGSHCILSTLYCDQIIVKYTSTIGTKIPTNWSIFRRRPNSFDLLRDKKIHFSWKKYAKAI
jgi:hypothetical protein